MITPANFLTNNHLASLRRFFLQQTKVEHILVIHEGVFRRVSVDSAIFVVTTGGPTKRLFPVRTVAGATLQTISERNVSVKKALGDELALFTGSTERGGASLWKKIAERSFELGTIADVNFGKQLRDGRASLRQQVFHII